MHKIFNPLSTDFKNPVGSVCEKTSIHFKIFLKKNLFCSSANLIIKDDISGQLIKNSMFWCGDIEHNLENWECDFTMQHMGLFWYYFEIVTCYGTKQIIKVSPTSSQIIDPIEQPNSWQITVFSKNFHVPKWLSGGIIYQIFPDRFYNSGKIKINVPSDRTLHNDWGGDPVSAPNENGIVTNSDYFCGDLAGIIKKLPYIKSLGVNCIYLNPIFLAHSNHRYNTADYSKVDPLLGSNEDLKELCCEAKKLKINIILDGVFSHTGSDSVYFNKEKRYGPSGAYNDKNSPYCSWYKFSSWPKKYKAWWGIKTLPEVNEQNPDFCEFITGENGILKKWMDCGVVGWRLDVADELPDSFIKKIRSRIKKENKNSILIGEVWEDASNKESYGVRRKYLFGSELDSVMNYPFRNAIIDFIQNKNAVNILNTVLTIVENYPEDVIHNLMNMLSTHDTERILTVVESIYKKSSPELCLNLLKIAVALQYTLPGVPSVFYGDEAGLTGGKDPFCRRCYPWGSENLNLIKFYQSLGNIRNNSKSLKCGKFIPLYANGAVFSFLRQTEKENLICAFNLSDEPFSLLLPKDLSNVRSLLGDGTYSQGFIILKKTSFALFSGNTK